MQPTIVYKVPGPFKGPKGHTHHWLGVKTEIELAKAKAEGYFDTMEEAVEAVTKVEKDPAESYEVGLKDAKDVELKPEKVKNLDGEEISTGAIGELPKRRKGRPKKKKEIFGEEG